MKPSLLQRLLEDQIDGFEYGDQLLADPTNGIEANFLKNNNIPLEPNTEDEKLLKKRLGYWIRLESFSPSLVRALKKIAPLKSKFPEVLDPKQSKKYNGGDFRRLTTVPFNKLIGLQWTINRDTVFGPYNLKTLNYEWKPKSNRGITSFTWRKSVIEHFYTAYLMHDNQRLKRGHEGRHIIQLLEQGEKDFEVGTIMTVDSSDENLLINPDYLHVISPDLDEGEVFYLYENSIVIPDMIIPGLSESQAEKILTYLS